jgi:hypothetical protein
MLNNIRGVDGENHREEAGDKGKTIVRLRPVAACHMDSGF